MARKSHRDSAVRVVTAKRGPERAAKTRQYDLLRPRVGQKKPPRLGSTICYCQTWARLLRPRVGQKKPPRLGSTICYGQELARKSHQDSAVRFVTAKRGPERATKTWQYDLLRPRVGQKSYQDSAVRFVTAKSWPEGATKTRQHDLLRPNVGQKKPPRLGSTICYGQTWARKSHQDSAVRVVTAKRGPERAAKTRQYDLLRPRVGQKEPPRLGSTICYGQTWARKSHQDSAVRIVTAKSWKKEPPRLASTICYGQTWARKSHQDSAVRLLRPRVGQKKPPRLGSTICYGQTWARKSHQDSAVRLLRPRVGQKEPPRLGNTIFTAKRGPERATKTRQYDLLRPRVGQKEPPRLGSTICYGQTWARKSHQDSDLIRPRVGQKKPTKTREYDLLRPNVGQKEPKTRQSDLKKATKTRQYDLLRPRVGQKKPPRLGSTTCYGQTWARKSHRRFVTAKSCPERTTKTRRCDLLRPKAGHKKPPRLGSTICYGQELARKSHQDSAVRFVTANSWPERATKTRQYDLLRPRVGQKEPPCDLLRPRVGKKEPRRLGSTICCGQEFGHKKSHQDSAVRFVTAKSWPERATKTRKYDLLRPNVGQKEPPRLGSTSCYGQELARKSHQDSAVRFVTAKSWPERATVRFVTAKSWQERATETRQYDLLRPRIWP